MFRHLTNTRQFTRQWMENDLFPLCDSLREGGASSQRLEEAALYCLFYEPSFLTRTSFERAMSMPGGKVQFTEDASQFFPIRTASYIEDTIKFLASLRFDVVVLRSSHPGAIAAGAGADVIPIINGGSDADHPTQALLDIYTLQRELGTVDGANIAVIGRVDHRNVNAFLTALTRFRDVHVTLFPFSGQVMPEVMDYCSESGMKINVGSSIAPITKELNVVYLNGAETAAHTQLVMSRNLATVKVDEELLSQLNPDCIIMDPMQRTEPIVSIDNDRRWAGYRQAENGLFVRMAILLQMLERNMPSANRP